MQSIGKNGMCRTIKCLCREAVLFWAAFDFWLLYKMPLKIGAFLHKKQNRVLITIVKRANNCCNCTVTIIVYNNQSLSVVPTF